MPSKISFLAPLALSAMLAACGPSPAAPSPAAPGPVPVTTVTLKTEPVTLTRELSGRVAAYLTAEVRPQVTGIVEERLFTEGSVVQQGDVLYRLDDATVSADVASAKASLARAEAAYESARLSARRSAELAKVNAVSRQANENAIAAQQQARAEVGVAKAALERSKSSVTQGALVTANQATALATVQQLDPAYVDLSYSSAELLELRRKLDAGTVTSGANLPLSLHLEDGSTYSQPAHFEFYDAVVNPGTGSFLVRAVVPNPDSLLQPGMYVRATVQEGVRRNGLLVPQQGITRDPKGNATAMVVDAEGKARMRQVQVSRTIGSSWLVEEGLEAGDRVIVEGLQKIRDGAPVKAQEAAAAAAEAAPAASPSAQ